MNEPHVVSLMKPNAWLVKDVEDINQLGANLSSQPNALALSARQRGGASRQREIVQAYVKQKLQPGKYLTDDFTTNLRLHRRKFKMLKPIVQRGKIHRGHFIDILPPDEKVQRLLVEPSTMTQRALSLLVKLLRPLLSRSRHFLVAHLLDILPQPVVVNEIVLSTMHLLRWNTEGSLTATEDFLHRFLGNVFQSRVHIALIVHKKGFYLPKYQRALIFAQRHYSSLADRKRLVRNDLVCINHIYEA